MKTIQIQYSHEFISNKVRDELLLYDIWNFKEVEKSIISEIEEYYSFNIGFNRDINTLSGGQRSVAYLVTLINILREKEIKDIELKMTNILESLSPSTRDTTLKYLISNGVTVKDEYADNK